MLFLQRGECSTFRYGCNVLFNEAQAQSPHFRAQHEGRAKMNRLCFAVRATLTCLICPSRFMSLAAEDERPPIQFPENENLRRVQVIRRTFWLSLLLTAIALFAGYPLGQDTEISPL